jgi:hypothetical protein
MLGTMLTYFQPCRGRNQKVMSQVDAGRSWIHQRKRGQMAMSFSLVTRRVLAAVASLLFLPALAATASAQHQIVCSGEAAGDYAAFPDVCRLKNGDLFCVFYSGYGTSRRADAKGEKVVAGS